MTFEPIDWPDEDESGDAPVAPAVGRSNGFWRRFWRSLTGRRTAAETCRPVTVTSDDGDMRPGHGPGVPGAMHLEAFGQSIADAFGDCPYHVGSSATSKNWRDVDVRLILDDDRFAALFPGFAAAHHIDAWWLLFCAAMSELGRARTGLPIDFQVQSMTEANEKYSGIRNPLFLIHARDEHRPAFAVRDAKAGDQ